MYDANLFSACKRKQAAMDDYQKSTTNDLLSDLQRETYISSYLEAQIQNDNAGRSRLQQSPSAIPYAPFVDHNSGMSIIPKLVDYAGPISRMSTGPTYNPSWNTARYPRQGPHYNDSISTRAYSNSIASSCMFTAQRGYYQNFRNHAANPWVHEFSQDPTMRSRPCFTTHQTKQLETEFNSCQYITRRRRIEIAYALNLTEKQIKTWFQNRRVKERKVKKPED